MGRFPAGKIRLWIGQPVIAPHVTPPMSLRTALVLAILSAIGTLAYAVFSQLGHTSVDLRSAPTLALIALLYFALPVLIASTIVINLHISRPLIAIYSLAITYQFVSRLDSVINSSGTRAIAITSIVLIQIGVIWWLYRSPRLRIYYALITSRPIPDDLLNSVDMLTSPGRFEAIFSRLGRTIAPFLEIAIVILVIAALLIGLSMTGQW